MALVHPTGTSPSVAEAFARIRGELTAEGFEVVVEPSTTDGPSPTPAGEADTGAIASIELSIDEDGHAAQLRVVDLLTKKTVSRRIAMETGDTNESAEVLAVRSVELLRASLLELLMTGGPHTTSPPPVRSADQASAWAARGLRKEPSPPPPAWAVETGVALVFTVGGIGPALLGVLRVERRLGTVVAVRATIAGLGTSSLVDGALGSATVSQDWGALELVLTPPTHGVVRPLLAAGAGALFVAVEGHASSPYEGLPSSRWAVAVDGGTGVQIFLGTRFALSFEGYALFARPYPVIQFLGTEVARAGEPSLFGTATVVGWL